MSVAKRSYPSVTRQRVRGLGLATTVAALAAAGCSADITRFDQPSFALNDSSSPATTAGRRNAGAPAFDDGPSQYQAAAPAPASRPVAVAALPMVAPPPSPPPSYATAPRAAAAIPAAIPQAPRPVARGEMIEVQQGDTLYGLGKRHNVMISELMAVNDLKNPNLRPGQKLYLPANAKTAAAKPPLQRVAAAAPAAAHPVQQAPAATDWTGSHQVKPGDSIYGIARQYGVKSDELQRVNGITDVQKMRPGTVLRVPGQQGAAPTPVAYERPAVEAVAVPETTSGANRGVNIINGSSQAEPRQQVATAEPVEQQAAVKPGAALKLRWPVNGRVVQKFGARADGSQNDGIDVAVPMGTDVLAAEAGTVAYAGSEVKTYGNLVLVRHDNGWVTAYAYNEQILVQRGDRVKRGQPIAKAGKSGAVDQPQLHFEVRVGAKPVDPLPYMDKL